MPVSKVIVKWGRQTFSDVELNTEEAPTVFKSHLYDLTEILPSRQRIMIKGSIIKDDTWGGANISDKTMVLLMGSKCEVPAEPKLKTVFVEDMDENELAIACNYPAGLVNFGNTCYLNATLQCLKTVPEFLAALKETKNEIEINEGTPSGANLVAALRDLYSETDNRKTAEPVSVLNVLLDLVPEFAERDERGDLKLQDASECWEEIISCLRTKLPGLNPGKTNNKCYYFIDQYFRGTKEILVKCKENSDEPITKTVVHFVLMECNISRYIKFLTTGLRSKLVEKITKFSEFLEREALYEQSTKLSRLPAYLTIQLQRFYYKEDKHLDTKILKEVIFPIEFDAFELCTEELQSALSVKRELFEEYRNKETENVTESTTDNNENLEEVPYSFPDDPGSNNSGYYTLQAVLTHKGRYSNRGHYLAWVKCTNVWLKCDDDLVSPVTEEQILNLSGGGDKDIAYILLYGPKILKIPRNQNQSS